MDRPSPSPAAELGGRGARSLVGYAGLLALAVVAFLGVRAWGRDLPAPPPGLGPRFGEAAPAAGSHTLLHVLVALIVVIAASRLLGAAFRYLQQPAVIGEVLAGILLGPSLLGRVAPEASAFLLPPTVAPFLGIIAQIGVILFMFLVGLELDTSVLRKKTHATLAISHASIVVPFVLGSALALWIYPRFSTADVPFGVFAMFLGVSISVTAFPVLARILTDRGLHKTRLGVVALSCAAVDDVSAWCLLALVVSVASPSATGGATTIGLSVLFIAAMVFVVRPLVARFVARQEVVPSIGRGASALVLVGLLVSSLATEAIGIHALFGAFLLGAIIPHESRLARDLTAKLEDLVLVLFLPAFFAFTGLRTQIGLVDGAFHWLVCGVIVLVACAGKFGGSTVAGRLSGLSWRDASSLGILMNTRGLMELVVLNIGLDLRVLSPTLFAMMVVMALVTTIATTPVLHLLQRRTSRDGAFAAPSSP